MYLIIFDCDGTLVDSQNMIVAAMDRAFTRNDLPPPSRSKVLSVVGLSLPQAFSVLVDGDAAAPVDRLVDAYKAAFFEIRTNPANHEPLYAGARETVERLHGRDDVLLAIATGKARRGVDAVLSNHDLQGRFASIQTADDAPSKPHPGMILQAMAETGVEAARTVVVGDTSYDMEMARAAGAHAVGVSWGYHPVVRLEGAGAHTIINDFFALEPAIAELVRWEKAS